MKATFISQFIGACLLVAAFALALFFKITAAAICLTAVGLLDLYLILCLRQKSVSWWIRGLTPYYIDRIVLVALVPFAWYVSGLGVAVWFTLGLLSNHLLEVQNRR